MMILTLLKNHGPLLFQGIWVTIQLTVLSLGIGLLLAIGMTLCTFSKYLKVPVKIFQAFIQGTPLLVQIFIVYYGLAQVSWLKSTPIWFILKRPFGSVIFALSLNTAAYVAALLQGAIAAIPKGEIAACKALGLPFWATAKDILLPRALRFILPAYANEVIIVLKSTSLASTVTLLDLMGATRQLMSLTYATAASLSLAGCLYLLLNGVMMAMFKLLTHKYAKPI